MMENATSSIIEEEDEESSGRYLYFRGRPLRTTGKTRSRYESSDDQIAIDFSRPFEENIRECLSNSINSGVEESSTSKQIRLNHLNNMVRLIEKFFLKPQKAENRSENRNSIDCESLAKRKSFKDSVRNGNSIITYEQILICLRCMLIDDEREIRAAALRALRYVIQSDEDLKVALRLHIDILIARCLDVVLDNRLERTQCLRLLISLVHQCAAAFPPSLVQLLLSISLDGQEENDKLARATTAALCELVIHNTRVVLECGGLTWLIRSILMSGQSMSRLAECLTTVLGTIYNHRQNRVRHDGVLKNVFYDLLAPLMDEHFKLSAADKEEKSMQLKAESEQVLDNCRAALVSALRSWPGLIGCFASSSSSSAVSNSIPESTFLHSPIYTLVASLCLDSDKIRDFAVEAICEVLNVPYQNEHWDTWEKTLDVADCIPVEEYKYSLTQQFANADAACLLGDWNERRRPNLTIQTTALILLGLVDAGLINALTRVIVQNPNRALELKMTLVLSDILELCGRYLPSVYRQLTLSLVCVLQSIYDDSPSSRQEQRVDRSFKPNLDLKAIVMPMPKEVQRQNAILLAHRLRILATLKERPKRIRTLQMENLLSKFGNNGLSRKSYDSAYYFTGGNDSTAAIGATSSNVATLEKTIPRVHTLKSMNQAQVSRSASLPVDAKPIAPKLNADRVHELIRDSRTTVPYSNYTAWDWSLIYLALCQMIDHKHHLDDSTCAKFTNQLIQFFDPVGGQYCKMSEDYRSYSRVGFALMKVMGSASWDSSMGVPLRTFLAHLVQNLLPDRLHVGQLSTKNILNGSCADYFIFVGQLGDTETGRLALERTGIMQRLVDLINNETHDAYIKLIISSMIDYDRSGMGRVLLQKALTSSKESARLYATTFLATLGKLKVTNFGDWGIEMLINQLRDSSRSVVEEAARILEELINDEEYLDYLIRLRPSLLPLGDAGVLMLTYVLCNEQAVVTMIKQQAPKQQQRYSPVDGEHNPTKKGTTSPSTMGMHNFVGNEIERWKTTFNSKYARIADERLCEAFSSYKRMADGSFPRHASSRSAQTMPDIYVPPHLYGQLAKHSTGCQLLQTYGCIPPLLDIVHSRLLTNEKDVLAMKGALWALGNIASTELGINLLPRTILAAFVKLAEECPVLTIRGCAFYVLNLAAQSGRSTRDRLRRFGWEASSSSMSLSDFYERQKRTAPILGRGGGVGSTANDETAATITRRHQHHQQHQQHHERSSSSRRLSLEDSTCENDMDAVQANLLSASVTSAGDILSSSASGSSPPRIPSPSIFIMTSPDASRKSSQATTIGGGHFVIGGRRYYRSHCSSGGDAHSVMTCGSCELCRGIGGGQWATMSSSGGGGTLGGGMGPTADNGSLVSSMVAGGAVSPIRLLCCEASSPQDEATTTMSMSRDDATRKSARSKSLGMADGTFGIRSSTNSTTGGGGGQPSNLGVLHLNTTLGGQSNYLTTNMLSPSRRDRTPSPKHSPGDRKISVPPMSFDSNRSNTYIDSIQEEHSCEIDFDALLPPPIPTSTANPEGAKSTAIMSNDGFFDRLEKRADSISICVRSSMGLKKIPMLPEDLPVVQASLGRVFRSSSTSYEPDFKSSEYITDENANGLAAWRQLQKQQRERTSSLDGGLATIVGDAVVPVAPDSSTGGVSGTSRTSRGMETSTEEHNSMSVEEERRSQSTTECVFHQGEQSPSLQRSNLRSNNEQGSAKALSPSGLNTVDQPVFVCLPLDIGLICNITDWPPSPATPNSEPQDQQLPQLPPPSFYPARHHMIDRCLRCRPFTSDHASMGSNTPSTSAGTSTENRRKSAFAAISEEKSAEIKVPTSMDQSAIGDPDQNHKGAAATTAFRKELLRLVTLLCVRKKYAEQGLLRLKQEAPQLFRSICVYSDISYIMSTYTFRLTARRFLQELFQDVDFGELWLEPRRFFQIEQHHSHHRPSAPGPL